MGCRGLLAASRRNRRCRYLHYDVIEEGTMRAVICALVILLGGSAWAGVPLQPARIAQQGRWLVDDLGRVVMLHGGNLLLSESVGAAGERLPRLLARNGFNAVRLVIFFSRLMPQPGAIDDSYLDAIGAAVAGYRRAGVYVLIDFHQDEYSDAVGGVRGFPAWAAFADGHVSRKLPFPAGYFSDPAIQAAFDNFWNNHPVPGTGKGVQDLYLQGLRAVAARFRDEPAVFGIDVMNEPFPGSRCNQPDPAGANCPALEQELLAPFYQRAGAVIGAAAPHTIAFVEPFMLQGALGVPMATPPAGAPALRGLSFHQYGTLATIRQRGNAYALQAALRSRAAILNTEWGFTNDTEAWNAQAQELDSLLIPWLAWARGPFAPIVDPALPAAGNDNRAATLRALARPYPRATAGTPGGLSFEPAGGTLRYTYSTRLPDGRTTRAGVTEIVMPAANFPAGYTVTVNPQQATVISAPDAPLLVLRASAQARAVAVTAVRKGELAPLPPPVRTADPYAFLKQREGAQPGALSSRSILGDLLKDARARAILDREVPDLVRSPQIGMGSQMSLRGLQAYVPELLDDATLERIDRALAALPPESAP
jgi:endoglycosylceramidase